MRMDIVWIRRLLLLFMYLFLFLRLVLSSTRSFQWLLLLVVLLPVSVVSRARRPWETPLASLTAFSELQQQQKKNGRGGRFKFLHSCLFDRGRACQNTRQPAGFSQKGNEWKTAPRTRDGEGQVLTRRGISTTEEVVTSTPELSSARNALAAQAPGWQLVNDGCQQHTTAVSVASS